VSCDLSQVHGRVAVSQVISRIFLRRHSSNFYKTISTAVMNSPASPDRRTKGSTSHTHTSVVALISAYCADDDPSTRKFASFAVGNAAFHSDELYPALAGSIAPLCSALRDPDDKTRANAAGAIGNLIRNGAQLCPAMVNHRVVELMLQLLISDPDVGPKVSSANERALYYDC
jgi:hypothetical protein